MNEFQRQTYLSALGIENYMPRWRLALAPKPVICELPILVDAGNTVPGEGAETYTSVSPFAVSEESRSNNENPLAVADVLRELQLDNKTPLKSAVPVVAPIVSPPTQTIAPFALSIWRPHAELLVIDSRNPKLALPTELLLNNIMHAVFGAQTLLGKEEVLRWPMVDNTFVSRTIDDARSVLQVWLEVELERRPVKHLLLMGKNAAQYFLPLDADATAVLFQQVNLVELSIPAIVAPSLIELLQQPLLKRDLWLALQALRQTV